MNTDEYKLLAHATRVRLNFQQQSELRRLLPLIKDMNRMVDMAIKEGVAGLYYKNFMKSKALHYYSDYQQKTLHTIYYRAVQFNTRLIRDLKEILNQLEHHGLEVVLLQGIDLLARVYDDFGLRPLTDIDLWVLEKDRRALEDVLMGLGYRKDPLYPLKFRKKATLLDLHTNILWADRITSRRFLLAKTQDHIYRHTRREEFEGLTVRSLGTYDRIIYLSLHLLKHDAQRLIWLVDIRNLMVDWKISDWKALLTRANELGQRKALSYILFLLIHLLDFQVPPEAHQFMEKMRLNLIETYLLRRRLRGNVLPLWAPLVLFSPEKGMRRRFIFILETLFPRPEILRQIFVDSPDLKVWQLYYLRVLQLFGMIRMSLKGKAGA
jgi:hypothetical protein